ncbi:transglycosylase SLT domain-containing protein [Streptomyces sp. NPDC026673]|uniref:aggregation-promoting factor C-terminal-like domain-containing protein n=1 Tax=Streptomyces sp. NPDC026673 TaxID=3155724 RepID=UPI0033D1F5F4
MSRISVRGFAVASATAVTTVGAVVGVAAGSEGAVQPVAAADATTVLADIPAGQRVQQASLTQQVQAQSDAADAGTTKAAEHAARRQAAKDASARKKAEDASRAALVVKASYTVAEVQAMAQGIIGDATQYQCFSNIVSHESSWNYTATNSSSGAYGLVQALPGTKMASEGADWRTNPATQIRWGLKYMNSSYGSPCGAWSFWQTNHWY